ncbi:hypothetical protein [Helicobacter salomonis]|uniref:hypothetical protein n=1 Tax=Helicobacter salomonis TaxID=56878 RepID=UPI0013154514|nr:hypothetical protein [Helicobacter salomonis]
MDTLQERAPTQSAPDTDAFIRAAQELYDSMVSAHKAASMLALNDAPCWVHMSDPTYKPASVF